MARPGGERARRYYFITDEGRDQLKSFRADWTEFAATVTAVLFPPPGTAARPLARRSPAMSDPVLARPQVKEYLRALDAACASLPVAQAEELHEMIAAHLDETLAPGASIAEVRAELNRLGPPGSLAATAAGPSRFPAPVTLVVLRRLRNQARRVRWRTWVAAAVLVPALGTGTAC